MAEADRRRQLVSAAVTLFVLVLIVGSVVGWTWWLWGGASRVPDDVALVELQPERGWLAGLRRAMQPPANNNPGGGGQARQPAAREGVRRSGNDAFSVRSGDTTLFASKAGDGKWALRLGYATTKFSSPDQPALLTAKYNSKSLNLTPEQLKQLNALPAFGGMVVTDEDRARIDALWTTYIGSPDAAKPDAEKALVQALGEVGGRALDPTKSAINAHVDKIRAILTPEQVRKLSPNR